MSGTRDTKDRTRTVLLNYYEKCGFEKSIAVAEQMLSLSPGQAAGSKSTNDFRAEMNGEICETVLEIGILEFQKRNPQKTKDWVVKRGLILKDIENPNSDFLTEIDAVLATPKRICLFECKSYSGDKEIVGRGTVRSKYRTFDVASQEALHAEVFEKQFNRFGKGKIQTVLFSFAKGSLVDKRSALVKKQLPVVEIKNLWGFLEAEPRVGTWRIREVKRALDTIERQSRGVRSKHLSYVKSLHG